jgi:hypothetical protein
MQTFASKDANFYFKKCNFLLPMMQNFLVKRCKPADSKTLSLLKKRCKKIISTQLNNFPFKKPFIAI